MPNSKFLYAAFGLLIGILIGALAYHLVSSFFFPVSVYAVFSPENGDEIISFIDSARQSLDIEMYVFTSDRVVNALKRAHDRGVNVRIILERRVISNENTNHYAELKAYGIGIKWASRAYALTHAKSIIADGERVLVGSHNFSENALDENREASVIIKSAAAAGDFRRVFEEDWLLAG